MIYFVSEDINILLLFYELLYSLILIFMVLVFSFFFWVKSCTFDASGGNREDGKYFSTSNC